MVVNGVVNGNKIKPHVTAVIQARMQSKRLPGKAMLELAGKPLLAQVIERTQMMDGVDTVVVATCIGEENVPIIELAQSMNTKCLSARSTMCSSGITSQRMNLAVIYRSRHRR